MKVLIKLYLLAVMVFIAAMNLGGVNDEDTAVSNDLSEQIKNGNFSSLIIPEGDDTLLAQLERLNENIEQFGYEWLEADLNGDGTKELILQAQTGHGSDKNRIVAILVFDHENQETEFVYFHNAGLLWFIFLSESGNIIRYTFTSGVIFAVNYTRYEFDDEWNLVRLYSLGMTYIWCFDDLPDDWLERNPGMSEVGLYFYKFADGQKEWLTESQFLEMFKEMTGFSFMNVKPDWIPFSWVE